MKLGVAQLRSGWDPWLNLLTVRDLIDQAAREKCDVVSFPENVFYRGPRETKEGFRRSETHLRRGPDGRLAPHSDFSRAVAELLADLPCDLSLGSVLEEIPGEKLPTNSHWFIRKDGSIESYSKIHLFVFESPQGSYLESQDVVEGKEPKVVDRDGLKIGLSICYDLRFPELFRELAVKRHARLLLVPAAFTRETGEAHWHTLLKARAIENLSFVAAAGQWGSHFDNKGRELFCYGHSLIIDPWGQILAEAPAEGDALITAEIDARIADARREALPVFKSVRLL